MAAWKIAGDILGLSRAKLRSDVQRNGIAGCREYLKIHPQRPPQNDKFLPLGKTKIPTLLINCYVRLKSLPDWYREILARVFGWCSQLAGPRGAVRWGVIRRIVRKVHRGSQELRSLRILVIIS